MATLADTTSTDRRLLKLSSTCPLLGIEKRASLGYILGRTVGGVLINRFMFLSQYLVTLKSRILYRKE
jgi:hypothetical protein